MLELHSTCPKKKNILTKNSFISDFFFIFEHWVIFWSILAKKVAELSKLDSQFHWKLSGESFLQNLHTVLFLNIEWKTFGWLSEKNLRGFQAAFYLSMGTFWRKCFGKVFADLWTFFLINSGNWAGKVWAGLSELHSPYLQNHFEKKLIRKRNETFYHF